MDALKLRGLIESHPELVALKGDTAALTAALNARSVYWGKPYPPRDNHLFSLVELAEVPDATVTESEVAACLAMPS